MLAAIARLVGLSVAVAAVVVAAMPSPSPAQDSGRADLTGTWQLVGWEKDGARSPNALVAYTLEIDAEAGSYRSTFAAGLAGGSEQKGTFKVVGVENGMFLVDLEYERTGAVGESNRVVTTTHTERGVWKLADKDTLVVCVTEGKDRPESSTTKKGDGRVVWIFERLRR